VTLRGEGKHRYTAGPHLKKAESIEGVVYGQHDGINRSRIFPGLHLNVLALLQGEAAAALATVQAGLDGTEREAFAARIGGG